MNNFMFVISVFAGLNVLLAQLPPKPTDDCSKYILHTSSSKNKMHSKNANDSNTIQRIQLG